MSNKLTHSSSNDLFSKGKVVDLKGFIILLWGGKWVILALTILFGALSTLYVLNKPLLYKSSSQMIVNSEIASLSSPEFAVRIPKSFLELTTSKMKLAIAQLASVPESRINQVSISYDDITQVITLSAVSMDPDEAYENVKVFTDNVNLAMRKIELDKLNLSLPALEEYIETDAIASSVRKRLGEEYALLLIRKALLEKGLAEFHIVKPAYRPSSHFAPNRLFLIILGVVFGALLGIGSVLIRHELSSGQSQ